jgi:uncharacterized small protein (DUF1192 family)
MKLRQNKKIIKQSVYTVLAGTTCLFLGVFYMYLLSSTIVHVVMQKEISQEIQNLNSEIANLEATYIEKQHSMSNEIASLQGFVAVEDKVFIDKTQTSLVLKTNGF